MVAPEDAYECPVAMPKAGSPSRAAELQWQPTRRVMVPDTPAKRGDWISLLLGLLGRRPPARRPALTAEA
jgi:hypothetical protein